MLLLLLVLLHLAALHTVGSNNQMDEIKDHKDKRWCSFRRSSVSPYYTIKDMVGIGVFYLYFQ
ncbi:MAG: hypothetical protein CM15mP93_01140 [Thiotrichaceae bacterium]|nr:MAG: hypothetical protein CM15mP93_01140 [Thiotrichaceae bacterium]